jgi:hypothetical protein
MNIQETRGVSKVVTIITIVILAAVGLGVYALTSTPETEDITQEQSLKNDESLNGKGSLKSLLALGRDLTCTFKNDAESGEVYGTVYVSGEQMRGDFQTKLTGDDKMESHLIRTDGMMYMWSGNQGTRFKEAASPADDSNQSIDLDNDVDYDCKRWSVDSSKFEVPGGITFTDLSDLMKGIPNLTTDTSTTVPAELDIDCSACDQIPEGSGRDQCQAALNC